MMKDVLEWVEKYVPPQYVGVGVGLVLFYFFVYLFREHTSHSEGVQDRYFLNVFIVVVAATILHAVNVREEIAPSSVPILLVPKFRNDESDVTRDIVSAQLESALNDVQDRGETVFRIPVQVSDIEAARSIAEKYKAQAVIYDGIVANETDEKLVSFRLMAAKSSSSVTFAALSRNLTSTNVSEILSAIAVSRAKLFGTAPDALDEKVSSLEQSLIMLQGQIRELKQADFGREIPSYGSKVGLFVGIDYANSPISQLGYTDSDVNSLRSVLVENYGFKISEILNAGATYKEIFAQLEKANEELGEEDLFVMYFVGHATVRDEVLHLVPVDGLNEDSDGLVPLTGLVERISELPAKHKLLILDTAHGTSGMEPQILIDGTASQGASNVTFQVLAGSQDDQQAYESQQVGGGVFTQAFVDALSNIDRRSAEGVWLGDLIDSTRLRMVEYPMRQAPKLLEIEQNGDIYFQLSELPVR